MAVKRFSGTFKTRTDVFDNITPNNIVVTPSGGIAVPAGEFKPANWLPVVWQGTASQDYFVISSGKVVGLDGQGRIYPAGYRKSVVGASAVSDVIVTYTSNDVTAKTIDIATGSAVAAAGTRTLKQVAEGLMERGLVSESRARDLIGGDYDATDAADQIKICLLFLSDPVGVCAYDVYHWAGEAYDTEGGLNFNNYQKQHLVQFFTQAQMQMPIAGLTQKTSQNLKAGTDWNPATAGHGTTFPAASSGTNILRVTSAQLSGLERYNDSSKPSKYIASGDAVWGFSLITSASGHDGTVAVNTARTTFTDANSVLANEKKSVADLTSAGDFYIDGEVNLVLVFDSVDSTGATPGNITATDLSYWFYDNRNGASTSFQQVSAVGDLRPGDWVTYDAYSNFCRLDAGAVTDVGGSAAPTTVAHAIANIGRVIAIKEEPLGLMERVRTAFDGSSFGASMQMPGSATKGYTDLLTLSKETTAHKVAIINVSFV